MELRISQEMYSDLLARVAVAEKMADKALNMAMEANIKVEAMKQSTHRVEWVNPIQEGIMPPEPHAPQEEEEAPAPPKLSPFNLTGFTARRQNLKAEDNDALENAAEDALWGDAIGDE